MKELLEIWRELDRADKVQVVMTAVMGAIALLAGCALVLIIGS